MQLLSLLQSEFQKMFSFFLMVVNREKAKNKGKEKPKNMDMGKEKAKNKGKENPRNMDMGMEKAKNKRKEKHLLNNESSSFLRDKDVFNKLT